MWRSCLIFSSTMVNLLREYFLTWLFIVEFKKFLSYFPFVTDSILCLVLLCSNFSIFLWMFFKFNLFFISFSFFFLSTGFAFYDLIVSKSFLTCQQIICYITLCLCVSCRQIQQFITDLSTTDSIMQVALSSAKPQILFNLTRLFNYEFLTPLNIFSCVIGM